MYMELAFRYELPETFEAEVDGLADLERQQRSFRTCKSPSSFIKVNFHFFKIHESKKTYGRWGRSGFIWIFSPSVSSHKIAWANLYSVTNSTAGKYWSVAFILIITLRNITHSKGRSASSTLRQSTTGMHYSADRLRCTDKSCVLFSRGSWNSFIIPHQQKKLFQSL